MLGPLLLAPAGSGRRAGSALRTPARGRLRSTRFSRHLPRHLLVVASTLAAIVFVAPAPAAQRRAERVLFDYETVQLATGVYAFIAPESRTPFVSGNSLVVIGEDGALVVDSTNVPSLARRMIADIRRWTDKPVRYVVNTHWHPDHLMGNAAYREAFPGVVIVGSSAMRAAADREVPAYLQQTLGASGAASIAGLKQVLASGKKPNGAALTDTDREFYELELADYDTWAAEARAARYVGPTATFDREMVVHLGAREVRLSWLGRGNTAGDTIAYVPDARVVATGDLLVGPTPYATASFLREWIDVLTSLTAIDAAAIVPGHGPVEHSWEHARLVGTLLQTVVDQVDRAVALGLSLEETRKQVDVSAMRNQMTGGDPFRARAFDNFFLTSAVDRAFRDAMYRAEK